MNAGLVIFIAVCLVSSVVEGFSLPAVARFNARSARIAMSDVYSDVSIVQSEMDPKTALLSGVKSYSRAEMNEYVLQLEKVNPTFNPATSDVLNGAWEIVTTGIGAYGMIGFQIIKTISSIIPGSIVDVSDVTVSISGSTGTASTTIKVVGASIEIAVNLDLESLSGARLKETYKDFKVSAIDLPLRLLPKFISSREMIVTYVDEDLLIVRDILGGPEILRRKPVDYISTTDYSGNVDGDLPSA